MIEQNIWVTHGKGKTHGDKCTVEDWEQKMLHVRNNSLNYVTYFWYIG